MLIKFVVAAFCAFACVAAAPTSKEEFNCANQPSAADVSRVEADYTRQFNNFNKTDDQASGGIWWLPWPKFWLKPIPVWWHVIQAGPTKEQGMLTHVQITTQIAVLNSNFAAFGFRFVLAGSDFTTNSTWFTFAGRGSPHEGDMKRKLHRGGPGTLNVYSTGFFNYATWPWNAASELWRDGVVIDFHTVPDGAFVGGTKGRVLVHEIGHWVGLYHTFQNGCNNPGDYVSDTPAEASPAVGCPVRRDSCPNRPGLDPIHNHMDLSWDICRTSFTPGQRSRARAAAINYRGIN